MHETFPIQVHVLNPQFNQDANQIFYITLFTHIPKTLQLCLQLHAPGRSIL